MHPAPQSASLTTATLRKSFGVFWLSQALLSPLMLWSGASLVVSNTVSGLLGLGALTLGLWSLWGKYWGLCSLMQALWLVIEGALLAWTNPLLLVHPLGVVSKSLTLLLLLLYTNQNRPALTTALSVVWLTEGLFPKILFQQEMELQMARWYTGWLLPGSLFLYGMGAAQLLSGVLVLTQHGALRRLLLKVQLVALLVLPLLVVGYDARLLFFPFGPLLKNIPILVGTWLILRPKEREDAQKDRS